MQVRPDIAGYDDLVHAFDLHGSLLAARATLQSALERRETRGAHVRSDHPDLDPDQQHNLLWTPAGITTAPIGTASPEVLALAHTAGDLPTAGRLLE